MNQIYARTQTVSSGDRNQKNIECRKLYIFYDNLTILIVYVSLKMIK